MSNKDPDEGFDDILAELDREEARIRVRMEMRRFGKPTTVVEGLKMSEKDLHELGTKMKKILAPAGPSRMESSSSRVTTESGASRSW